MKTVWAAMLSCSWFGVCGDIAAQVTVESTAPLLVQPRERVSGFAVDRTKMTDFYASARAAADTRSACRRRPDDPFQVGTSEIKLQATPAASSTIGQSTRGDWTTRSTFHFETSGMVARFKEMATRRRIQGSSPRQKWRWSATRRIKVELVVVLAPRSDLRPTRSRTGVSDLDTSRAFYDRLWDSKIEAR